MIDDEHDALALSVRFVKIHSATKQFRDDATHADAQAQQFGCVLFVRLIVAY